jgi:hypothetical protein
MAERRSVPRQRTFLKAVLSFHSGNSSEDCLVRNLGLGGALIELPHPNAPGEFDLIVPARDFRRHARAVWRNGGHIGLTFDGEAAPLAPRRARAPVDDRRY